MNREKIYVVDFGGQYTQLIAKSVRKCNVFSEIVDCETKVRDIILQDPKGIILSGGPDSVYEKDAPAVDQDIFTIDIPILGICYGMHLTNHLLGGKTLHGEDAKGEYGETQVTHDTGSSLFSGLEEKIVGWMSHGDSVDGKNLAPGFDIIAYSPRHAAAIANDEKRIYGVQFHPEVTHTPRGQDIISNFVHDICGCGKEWTMGSFIEEAKDYVRQTVGTNDVICFVSGGVDSTFAATLINQVEGIGQVHTVYIDGLMRKNETEEVVTSLKQAGIENLQVIRAEQEFIDALKGVSEPEAKRKIIGNLFGRCQQRYVEAHGLDPDNTFLGQGTLYTDTIESGKGVGKKASNIKSHHNVGCPFIEEMKKKGRLVEPNRLIFKDEVREAAKEIGLPPAIYQRQPYPGPGGGIRIVDGEHGYDAGFFDLDKEVWKAANDEGMQGYALPVRTVGVQGDYRTYENLALLRGPRDWDRMRNAAKRICDEVRIGGRRINRVVYDLNPDFSHEIRKPAPIRTPVDNETYKLWQDIDFEGRMVVHDKYSFKQDIAQTIFVLFGVDIYNTGSRSAALRAVQTDDFMTVTPVKPVQLNYDELQAIRQNYPESGPKMTWECLDVLYHTLTTSFGLSTLVYDISDKPPATTCWE